MKNLAVFLDFKQNKLTNNSKSLLTFANSLVENHSDIQLHLYTVQAVNKCNIPDTIKVESITSFEVDNHVYFSTNASLDNLVSHLKLSNITHIFSSKSILNDLIGAKLSMILHYELITNIKSLQVEDGHFYFFKSIFSGKAIAKMNGIVGPCIAIFPKGFTGDIIPDDQTNTKEIKINLLTSAHTSTSIIIEESLIQGDIQLSEAEIVVGAGRGLKDPQNWEIIEKLAGTIKAATACSKPVSDLNWRPHHEHVGQTGIKISPKLYIACGISGAIQHLAGVNGSGTIVVINNDPEAPFIKHADYIVLGDLFTIVPELTKLFDEV
jgi:electron transfer flavoprotein alpha subunit